MHRSAQHDDLYEAGEDLLRTRRVAERIGRRTSAFAVNVLTSSSTCGPDKTLIELMMLSAIWCAVVTIPCDPLTRDSQKSGRQERRCRLAAGGGSVQVSARTSSTPYSVRAYAIHSVQCFPYVSRELAFSVRLARMPPRRQTRSTRRYVPRLKLP